jgi:hypothetical protein
MVGRKELWTGFDWIPARYRYWRTTQGSLRSAYYITLVGLLPIQRHTKDQNDRWNAPLESVPFHRPRSFRQKIPIRSFAGCPWLKK